MTPIQLARYAAIEDEIYLIATQIITMHQYGQSKPVTFYIDEVEIGTDQVCIQYTEYSARSSQTPSSHVVSTTEFCDPNVLLDSVIC
jgi:hypothetical protein